MGVSIFPGVNRLPMAPKHQSHFPPTTLATETSSRSEMGSRDRDGPRGDQSASHDLDWSTLMAGAQEGNREAYRRLLEDVTPYLRSLAVRYYQNPSDIEDAVQDVLLTVHAIRHTYDPTRPFGPWLVAIAKRRIIDRLRREGRLRSRETALNVEHETFPAPQANLDQTVADRLALQSAIESLSPTQRRAMQLLKVEELSLKEAAAVSGMSITSLKLATHRALKKLRKMLAERSDGT